jgi:hypothetical protein
MVSFNSLVCSKVVYLPRCGPTLATYDELAVMAESGTSPDSIPNGKSHEPVKKSITSL